MLYGNSLVEASYGGYVGTAARCRQCISRLVSCPSQVLLVDDAVQLPDRLLYANPLKRYFIGDRRGSSVTPTLA